MDPELDQIAQRDFGKSYDQLDTDQKRHCAGRKGQAHLRGTDVGSMPESTGTEEGGAVDQELEQIAQSDFGKPYNQLDTNEKRHCAGKKGQAHLRQQA
jgi:hypothetical protein